MPIPSLPLEILNHVVDELVHSDSPSSTDPVPEIIKTLLALSLVSRAFIPQSRFHLFSVISLYQNGVTDFLQLLESPWCTIPLANTREFVVSTNLVVEGEREDEALKTLDRLLTWRRSRSESESTTGTSQQPRDLSLSDIFPNLKKLSLNWIGWDTLSSQARETLHQGFRSVEQISLWNVEMHFEKEFHAFLMSFPVLSSLDFDGCVIYESKSEGCENRTGDLPLERDIVDDTSNTLRQRRPAVQSIKLLNLSDRQVSLLRALHFCQGSLRVLHCHFVNYSDARVSCTKAIGELVSVANDTLEEFTLEVQAAGLLREGFDLGMHSVTYSLHSYRLPQASRKRYSLFVFPDRRLAQIDLSKASKLKHLALNYDDVDATPFLERLSSRAIPQSPPSLKIISLMRYLPVDTLALDNLLQRPTFSSLSEIRYSVVTGFCESDVQGQPPDTVWYEQASVGSPAYLNMKKNVENTMKQMPKCRDRGILRPHKVY